VAYPLDDGHDFEPVLHFHHVEALPQDAERMGLDRNTQEGAMIGMAGSLSSAKQSHRIVAWLILLSLTVPLLFTLMRGLF
jgi:hypothetical protein